MSLNYAFTSYAFVLCEIVLVSFNWYIVWRRPIEVLEQDLIMKIKENAIEFFSVEGICLNGLSEKHGSTMMFFEFWSI